MVRREPLRRHAIELQRRLVGAGSWWDLLPRGADLSDRRTYVEALGLHWTLLRNGYTMLSSRRGRTLFRLARMAERSGIQGALVDCGTWNGGSTILLSRGAPGRQTWAFDSFEGLPEPSDLDGDRSWDHIGDCLGSEQRLRAGFVRFADPDVLHVRKGWFEATLPPAAPEVGAVAVLHCDGDWYESVKVTLETFYPRIPSGGLIAVDDYGHWVGAREATDDFRARVGDQAPLHRSDDTGRWWRKP